MNIKGQSFLKLLDFTPEQITEFLALAAKLKAKKKYYVRIRAYKTVKVKEQSVKIYSSWSKVRKIKVK